MKKLIELMKKSFKKRFQYYEFDNELNTILASVQDDFDV